MCVCCGVGGHGAVSFPSGVNEQIFVKMEQYGIVCYRVNRGVTYIITTTSGKSSGLRTKLQIKRLTLHMQNHFLPLNFFVILPFVPHSVICQYG